jgi:hypothetical protein
MKLKVSTKQTPMPLAQARKVAKAAGQEYGQAQISKRLKGGDYIVMLIGERAIYFVEEDTSKARRSNPGTQKTLYGHDHQSLRSKVRTVTSLGGTPLRQVSLRVNGATRIYRVISHSADKIVLQSGVADPVTIVATTTKSNPPKASVTIPKGKRKGDTFTRGGKKYIVISYIRNGKRTRFARRV